MKLKRPLLFAAELLAALFLSTVGAWIVGKTGNKLNAKANGDIRAAAAQERIADALERAYPRRAALLRRVDLKSIPQPDPDPCGSTLARLQSERCGLASFGFSGGGMVCP